MQQCEFPYLCTGIKILKIFPRKIIGFVNTYKIITFFALTLIFREFVLTYGHFIMSSRNIESYCVCTLDWLLKIKSLKLFPSEP